MSERSLLHVSAIAIIAFLGWFGLDGKVNASIFSLHRLLKVGEIISKGFECIRSKWCWLEGSGGRWVRSKKHKTALLFRWRCRNTSLITGSTHIERWLGRGSLVGRRRWNLVLCAETMLTNFQHSVLRMPHSRFVLSNRYGQST